MLNTAVFVIAAVLAHLFVRVQVTPGVALSMQHMPGVWVAAEHQVSAWCNQLTSTLAELLVAVAADATDRQSEDARTVVASTLERYGHLRRRALSGPTQHQAAQHEGSVTNDDVQVIDLQTSETLSVDLADPSVRYALLRSNSVRFSIGPRADTVPCVAVKTRRNLVVE